MTSFSEVVRTVDFDPYETIHGGLLRFRLEILKSPDDALFYARVYRRELLRVQPTFPQAKGVPIAHGDCEVFVLDDVWAASEFCGSSATEVLEKVRTALDEMFIGKRT